MRATINSALQRVVEATLQEGLARYELNSGRYKFEGPEANISDAVRQIAADLRATEPAWLVALKTTRLPLYDVHWEAAVVLENTRGKRGDAINVGLTDGSILPLNTWSAARQRGFWSPRNYDGGASGAITLRRALENSRNLATAQLLATGLDDSAEQGLDRVCELAMEAQLYKECMRYYPFVLGAQTVRLIDLAAFYAAIANEGARPQPHAIETIEQDGRAIYRHDPRAVDWIGFADRASFYQLKSMLQGVLARGTAHAVKHLSPYAGGKTGTTDNWADAWFVGFTNDVTVAIWVGYDNGDGGRRTLGRGQTGAKVALPMFEPIVQAAWELHAPRTALNGPSREAMHQLVTLSIDPYTGDPAPAGSGRALPEYC